MIAETVQSLSSDNNAGIGGLYIVVLWQPEPSDECECLTSKPFRQTAGPPVILTSKTSSAVHHAVFVSQFHVRRTGGGNPQKLSEQVSRVAREVWQLWSTQTNVATVAIGAHRFM